MVSRAAPIHYSLLTTHYSPKVGTAPAAPLPGYLIACGLIGEPVPPVMISGGPQKKNS